jgi:hypothetical protein
VSPALKRLPTRRTKEVFALNPSPACEVLPVSHTQLQCLPHAWWCSGGRVCVTLTLFMFLNSASKAPKSSSAIARTKNENTKFLLNERAVPSEVSWTRKGPRCLGVWLAPVPWHRKDAVVRAHSRYASVEIIPACIYHISANTHIIPASDFLSVTQCAILTQKNKMQAIRSWWTNFAMPMTLATAHGVSTRILACMHAYICAVVTQKVFVYPINDLCFHVGLLNLF